MISNSKYLVTLVFLMFPVFVLGGRTFLLELIIAKSGMEKFYFKKLGFAIVNEFFYRFFIVIYLNYVNSFDNLIRIFSLKL